MKPFILSVLFACFSFSVFAQHVPELDSAESKFFVGIVVSNTSYPIMGEHKYEFFGSITPFVNINYGYKLTKRATIQLGIGYGGNEMKGGTMSRYISPDSVYDKESYQQIRAIVLPVTFKFTPFNPYKRLQLYANASVAPVFGHIKARATENYKGEVSTVLYDEQSMTFDLVATAGLTLNYKISKSLTGYVDAILLYKNFDFQRPPAPGRYLENKSAVIGLNYNLH
ncbi:hypothetical protein [Pontibacter liquoris]|uniref:hypothetical protein n=1 Tax=Pontibacter liquoris TaxID=2905677 RepID=UPI001FA6C960|nr:hypothetical protein [Pontibacter liquoris]